MTQQAKGEAAAPAARRKGMLRRRALWTAGVIAVVAATVWLGLPFAIRFGVESWLRAEGATTVGVGRVEVGLLDARIELQAVHAAADAKAGLAFGRMVATLELPPLLDRRVVLKQVVLDDVDAAIARGDDGTWRIGWLVMAGNGQAPAVAAPGDWAFGVRALELHRARLAIRAFGIDDTLRVERLLLGNLVGWDSPDLLTLDAAFGLGTATLGAKGAARPFGAAREARIEVDASAIPLAQAGPALRSLGVTGLAGQARLKATLTAADRNGALRLGLSGQVGLDGGAARAGSRSVAIDGLGWQGDATLDISAGAALDGKVDGKLSLGRVEARFDGTAIDAGGIGWTASWQLHRAAGATAIEATSTGEATGKSFAATLADAAGRLQHDGLRWNGKTDVLVDPGRTLYGYVDGTLALDRPRGEAGGVAAAASSATWQGAMTASRAGEQGDIGVMMTASVNADDLAMHDPARGLDGQVRSAGWQGEVEMESWDGAPELYGSADGRVTLRDAQLDDTRSRLHLASAVRAESSGVFAGFRGDLFVRDLDVGGLRALVPIEDATEAASRSRRPATPGISARGLFVESIGLTADGIDIGDIRLDDMVATLVHEGGGRFAGLSSLLDRGAANPAADDPPATATDVGLSSILAVGPLRIAGDSGVTIIDRASTPPVRSELQPLALAIGRMSTFARDADTPVRVRATLKPHARIALDGSVRPFAPRPTLALSARADALDLAPLSRYAEKYFGVALKTGQLDGDGEWRVDAGKLVGVGNVDVRRLEVEMLDTDEAAALAELLPVSLDSALDLLRDDQNRIRVAVPVSGDIADPQFDLSDAINQAVGKAISDTVTTTLKVLFPLGALAAAIIDDASSEGELRFTPVAFEPGSAALDAPASIYLDQLSRLLAERPRVHVSLCGAATEADRQAMVEALRAKAAAAPQPPATAPADGVRPEPPKPRPPVTVGDPALDRLARARAAAVYAYLTDARGIEAARLASCRPRLDKQPDAKPHLDVLL